MSSLPPGTIVTFSNGGGPLPWSPYLQSFEMKKSITDEPSRAVCTFHGISQEQIAKAALAINQNLQFRWGTGSNVSIPHNYVIHNIDLKYVGDRSLIKLHLMDCRLHMMSNSAFSAYPHKSFSDIVSAVGSSYNKLPAPVVKQDKYMKDVLQTGSHHWAFLSALKKEGCKSTSNGDSDYRLYFRGGDELHFHPPDYKQAPYRSIMVQDGTTALDLNMRLAPWKPIVKGSVGSRTTNFFRDSSTPYTSSSSQSAGSGGAKPIKSTAVGAFPGKYSHSYHDNQQLIDKDSSVSAEQATYDGDSMEFTVLGDAGMEHGCTVQIVNPGTKSHGLWLVESVYHHIEIGEGTGTQGKTKIRVSRTSGSAPTGGSGGSAYSGQSTAGGSNRSASGVT